MPEVLSQDLQFPDNISEAQGSLNLLNTLYSEGKTNVYSVRRAAGEKAIMDVQKQKMLT